MSSGSSSYTHFTVNSPWYVRLRVGSLLLALLAVGFWASRGAHLGWTQNKREIRELDPITELEKVTYVEHYVPGLDHLALGLAIPFLMFAVSFLPVKRQFSRFR